MSLFNMRRNQWAFLISLIALATITVVYADMFLWSKVSSPFPAWVAYLPFSNAMPLHLVFAALLPAAFMTDSFKAACRTLLKVSLLAPIATLVVYAIDSILHHSQSTFSVLDLIHNVLFNYVFILGFFIIVPIMILMLLRGGIHLIHQQSMR